MKSWRTKEPPARGGDTPLEPGASPVPPRVLLISLAALAVPAAIAFVEDPGDASYDVLLWLLALVPAFLLAFYRGWQGAAAALAGGMSVLVLVQVALVLTGRAMQSGPLFVVVVAAFIFVTLAVGQLSAALHHERRKVAELALTDPLTGLPNRRRIEQFLMTEFAAAQRGRALAIVLFDLDRFKQYNDTYGHAAGDEALRVFARALATITRRMDVAGRYGGEEFVAVLSEADAPGALVFADRVRAAVAETAPRDRGFTVSAGVAAFEPAMSTAADLVAAADRALYAAKESGRDRAAAAPASPTRATA